MKTTPQHWSRLPGSFMRPLNCENALSVLLWSLIQCCCKKRFYCIVTVYTLFAGDFFIFFSSGNDILVGYQATAQSDHNPLGTLYDAKRFIGRKLSKSELLAEGARYPFKVSHFCISDLLIRLLLFGIGTLQVITEERNL